MYGDYPHKFRTTDHLTVHGIWTKIRRRITPAEINFVDTFPDRFARSPAKWFRVDWTENSDSAAASWTPLLLLEQMLLYIDFNPCAINRMINRGRSNWTTRDENPSIKSARFPDPLNRRYSRRFKYLASHSISAESKCECEYSAIKKNSIDAL